MAQIRVKKGLEGVYKAKYAVLFSIIITFFLSNKYVKFSSSADYITNFKSFFTDSSLLVLLGLSLARSFRGKSFLCSYCFHIFLNIQAMKFIDYIIQVCYK